MANKTSTPAAADSTIKKGTLRIPQERSLSVKIETCRPVPIAAKTPWRPQRKLTLDVSRGDLCIAEIPFTDCTGSKVRPCLVLYAQALDLVIAPLTTRPPRQVFDVELRFWAAAGLSRQSTIRCARLSSISRLSIHSVMGRALPEDCLRVLEAAKLWFEMILDWKEPSLSGEFCRSTIELTLPDAPKWWEM